MMKAVGNYKERMDNASKDRTPSQVKRAGDEEDKSDEGGIDGLIGKGGRGGGSDGVECRQEVRERIGRRGVEASAPFDVK